MEFAKKQSAITLDQYFGLYDQNQRNAIPLKNITISANIDEFISKVTYTQTYYNDKNTMLETEYFFPISIDACYDGFKARVGDKIIEGLVKEKEQAKKEYKETIKKGNTAAYAELNEKVNDIMKVQVGNIPPLTEIEIEFSYLERVEVSMNKFNKFTIYSTLTPRYSKNPLANQDTAKISQYPFFESIDQNAYNWSINVTIQSKEAFSFINSPTHADKIQIEYLKNDNSDHIANIKFAEGKQIPDSDFILYYKSNKINKIQTKISKFEQSNYCSLIKFIPKFNEITDQDAFLAASQNRGASTSLNDISQAKCEFIFLIDRSGSMSGSRVQKAKEALIIFLKSLPLNSYFNVVSFGTNFDLMNKTESIKCTEESLENAINEVKNYSANLGGTEILQPLEYIAEKLPQRKGYPRSVFLLTDGGVSYTNKVINLIQQNNLKQRVFCIGIGSGCSTELIKSGAKNGYGTFEFVSDYEDTTEKVIYLLKSATQPYFTDFKVEFEDKSMVTYAIPALESLNFILPDQLIDLYIIYNERVQGKKTSITFHYYDGTLQQEQKISTELRFDSSIGQNEALNKLSIFKLNQCHNDKKTSYDTLTTDTSPIANDLVALSIKYQILTNKTAFICNVQEGNDVTKQIPTEKVLVPQVEKQSYVKVEYVEEEEEEQDDLCCALFCNDDGDGYGGYVGGGGGVRYVTTKVEIVQDYKGDTLAEIISAQKLSGYWEGDTKTAKLLGANFEKIKYCLPQEMAEKNAVLTFWLSVLVLAHLEKQHGERYSSWEIIYHKCIMYLEQTYALKYEEFKEIALQSLEYSYLNEPTTTKSKQNQYEEDEEVDLGGSLIGDDGGW